MCYPQDILQFSLKLVFIVIDLSFRSPIHKKFDPVVDVLQSLESHARTLSETRSNDKKRIQDLERELSNCSQEIGSGHIYFYSVMMPSRCRHSADCRCIVVL